MNQKEFFSKFNFNHGMSGFIGIEQEWFIVKDGAIVPYAEQLLRQLKKSHLYLRAIGLSD
jgi:hypothetical protein